MRFDVSEMKTLAECSRKWEISSRNAMHLKPRGINSNLAFGTLMPVSYTHLTLPTTSRV